MESSEGATTMNPRGQIDNRLELIQKDLDSVEKRLVRIITKLLGPRLAPGDQAREVKKTKAADWFDQVISRLDKFRSQLGRIKELEKDLCRSIIDSPVNILEERKEPASGGNEGK